MQEDAKSRKRKSFTIQTRRQKVSLYITKRIGHTPSLKSPRIRNIGKALRQRVQQEKKEETKEEEEEEENGNLVPIKAPPPIKGYDMEGKYYTDRDHIENLPFHTENDYDQIESINIESINQTSKTEKEQAL